MGTMIKNFYKANEKLKEETEKIWSLACHMTNPKFISKIYLEEKVYNDGIKTKDKWFQFKEEIVYLHNSYNRLLPTLNNAQFIEVEAMREANHFINELYEMVMTLDFRLKETKENRSEVLKSGLENIKVICTRQYCRMSMNELDRKTRVLEKKNRALTIKEMTSTDGDTWKVAESYQEECLPLLKTIEEINPKYKKVYQNTFATNEEKAHWEEELRKEIDEYREKILNRNSNINTFEDWRNLEVFTKTALKDYSWFINQNRTRKTDDFRMNDLEFLIKCIDAVKEKYKNHIEDTSSLNTEEEQVPSIETDLPEIMKHIETLCISNSLHNTMQALERLVETKKEEQQTTKVNDFLGQVYTILEIHEADFKEMDKNQKDLYPLYQEALTFINSPVKIETHTL